MDKDTKDICDALDRIVEEIEQERKIINMMIENIDLAKIILRKRQGFIMYYLRNLLKLNHIELSDIRSDLYMKKIDKLTQSGRTEK